MITTTTGGKFGALRGEIKVWLRRVLCLSAVAAALAVNPVALVQAQSMEPLSYTNSPIGLNFLIAGYAYQWGNVLVDPSLPVQNVKATVDDGFLAYSRVVDFWGQSGSFALVMPYAWVSASGEVFERARTVERDGLDDLTLRVSVNLFGAPALSLSQYPSYHQDLIVGVSLYVTAPSGQYDAAKLVNVGTNRWSFRPELGVSKRIGAWTFEGEADAEFFTDNDEYLGSHVRSQEPLYSLQGHVIYNVNPKLWLSLDGTYYTGGRTSVNGALDNDLQSNSRWGGTAAYSVSRRNSIKLYYSNGLTARTGTEFRIVGIAWQNRWGAGL
ncbi:MAG: transporter [Steroidobacteraceae bacterium]